MNTELPRLKIAAVGDLTLDLVFHGTAELPIWGREVEVEELDERLGGNLGNLAVAAASLPLDLLCMGPVGADARGEAIVARLREIGLTTDHVRRLRSSQTSLTAAFIRADGERAFVTFPGVLRDLSTDLVKAVGTPSDAVFLTGWCQPPRLSADVLLRHIAELRNQGRPIALDLAWHASSWHPQARLTDVLAQVDHLLLNEEELKAISGEAGLHAGLAALARQLGETRGAIVVKLGAKGAAALAHGAGIIEVPAEPVDVLDSVGAGDAFNAAYLYSTLALGLSTRRSLDFAVVFSSRYLELRPRASTIDLTDVWAAIARRERLAADG